jgi:hypothetical protein
LLINVVKKGKVVPVIGCGGPWSCETSRLPHFLDNRLTDGGYCVNRCFGGTYRLHLQGRKIRRLQPPAHAGFLLAVFSTLKLEQYVPPKRRFTQDLHGATSQKTAFFIVLQSYNSSETTPNFYQTTRRHISEESGVHSDRLENIRTLQRYVTERK